MVAITPLARELPAAAPLRRFPGPWRFGRRIARIVIDMNQELADAMVESVQEVFHRFLDLEVAEEATTVRHEMPETEDPDEVATLIGFSGALRGAVIVRSSMATARILAHALSGRHADGAGGPFLDLQGELADLLAGGIRARLACHGELHLAPPTTVTGQGFRLRNASIFTVIGKRFRIAGGGFTMECFYLKDFS
ncbi:MAG: chemotaxis protein CheX [Magnetococcales bacterium]|nr:chemotaxis protein CheX [Magnetococcales bacterium]